MTLLFVYFLVLSLKGGGYKKCSHFLTGGDKNRRDEENENEKKTVKYLNQFIVWLRRQEVRSRLCTVLCWICYYLVFLHNSWLPKDVCCFRFSVNLLESGQSCEGAAHFPSPQNVYSKQFKSCSSARLHFVRIITQSTPFARNTNKRV